MQNFSGIRWIDKKLATENLTPGFKVYGEQLVKKGGAEYRLWNPTRSKLGAALVVGLKELPIAKDSRVLYLGAANGTTASHISDIAADGVVYCVEFSKRAMQDLMRVCGKRRNMVPLLEDARRPEDYESLVSEVDVIYQDVAQPDQAEILKKNARKFLRKGGYAMIAIKARSIDTVRNPKAVFDEELEKIRVDFDVLQVVDIGAYEKDHVFVLAKRK